MAQQPSVQMDENLVQQLRLLIQTEVAALKSGATGGSSSQLPSGVATLSQTGSVVSGGTEPPSKRLKTGEEGEDSEPKEPGLSSDDEDDNTFSLSEAGSAFMETAFKSKMNATSRRKKMAKLGFPTVNGRSRPNWTHLSPLLSLKRLLRMITRPRRLRDCGWKRHHSWPPSWTRQTEMRFRTLR